MRFNKSKMVNKSNETTTFVINHKAGTIACFNWITAICLYNDVLKSIPEAWRQSGLRGGGGGGLSLPLEKNILYTYFVYKV